MDLPPPPDKEAPADSTCIFCAIVAGTAPSSPVYEDEHSLAFMDLAQETGGHVLVIPKTHYASLAELPPATGAHLFRIAQRAAAALRGSGIRCDGVMLGLADGEAAGQEVFHVHLHVHTRFRDDRFSQLVRPAWQRQRVRPPREELDRLAAKIRQAWPAASGGLA